LGLVGGAEGALMQAEGEGGRWIGGEKKGRRYVCVCVRQQSVRSCPSICHPVATST
jgi:hypothetical protein